MLLMAFFASNAQAQTRRQSSSKSSTSRSKSSSSKSKSSRSKSSSKSRSSSRRSPAARASLGESIILLPPDYDPSRTYPLLVLMPYTGGSSIDFFNKYMSEARARSENQEEQFAEFLEIYRTQFGSDRSFILMLTQGAGSRAHHSASGFAGCIHSYEERLDRDFKKFFAKYSIDRQRVFIGGVSLGGDLSWALSLRKPDWFQGAIVTGSRCSYPPENVLPRLASKHYSFFMVMGMDEAPERLSGIAHARKLLANAGVEHSYREMPYLEHDRAPLWLFMEAIEYVMFQDHSPAPAFRHDASLVERVFGDYSGNLDIKKYKLDEENEILKRGSGLWLLASENTLEKQTLRIGAHTNGNGLLQFNHPDLPNALQCYLTKSETGEITIFIPEQDFPPYRYKGIAVEIDAPQHGIWVRNRQDAYLSIDLERYNPREPRQRNTYSFFSLLK